MRLFLLRRWVLLVKTSSRVLIVSLVGRSPILSKESAKPPLFESQGGMSVENSPEEVPPMAGKIQEVDSGVDHGWAAVYQTFAKRMLEK